MSYNVHGVLCGTYEEACIVAGIETPEQLRREAEVDAVLGSHPDDNPLREPVYCGWCAVPPLDDEIPF